MRLHITVQNIRKLDEIVSDCKDCTHTQICLGEKNVAKTFLSKFFLLIEIFGSINLLKTLCLKLMSCVTNYELMGQVWVVCAEGVGGGGLLAEL